MYRVYEEYSETFGLHSQLLRPWNFTFDDHVGRVDVVEPRSCRQQKHPSPSEKTFPFVDEAELQNEIPFDKAMPLVGLALFFNLSFELFGRHV